MNLQERVITTIQDNLDDRGEIELESHLVDDLMIDSFDKLMIITALEDEFEITIDEEDFQDIATVKDIVGKLENIL